MKIFGKRIGEYLNLIIGGKPKTIKPESPEKMTELIDLVKKSNDGDEKSTEALKKELFTPTENIIKNDKEFQQLTENVVKAEKSHEVLGEKKKTSELISQLENNPLFDIKVEENDTKYYLKGFKAELPLNLVEKIAALVAANKDYSHLIKFWQMNLLNPNPEARRGLYKYLTKQKLIVTPQGYFITFRRIRKVTDGTEFTNTFNSKQQEQILAFGKQVRAWKKNKRAFDLYQNSQGEYSLIRTETKNKNTDGLSFVASLYDAYEQVCFAKQKVEVKATYTDNYSKKMVIRLNEPVKLAREKCDSNAHNTCSRGLHVGVPSFVRGNSGNGDTIVACLINAMHVVSVPYTEAEKMRVCEYLPFMVISVADLDKFAAMDVSLYETMYKEIEESKLKQALDVIDELSKEDKKSLGYKKTIPNEKDYADSEKNVTESKNKLEEKRTSFKTLLDDDISSSLDMDEIRRILKARLS
jgi:hypothetical protein